MRSGRLFAGLVTAAVAVFIALATSSHGADEVSVYPAAGTPVASPNTQVSFRGAARGEVTGVRVTGSRTGGHAGRLVAHSDGNGASFLPSRPFAPGETVTVRADQPLVGERDGAVSFRIFTPVRGLVLAPKPDAGGTAGRSQRFRTELGLRPPAIDVLTRTAGAAPGDLMTAPKINRGQDGAMIADPQGRLIWSHPAPPGTSIYDFRAQRYLGKAVLPWWEGRVLFAKGYGQDQIYDSAYRRIATVRAANGYLADLHEFQLTSHGTAFITAFHPVRYDLSSVGGAEQGAVFDSVVQEIDIRTGLVEFEWHSLGKIPLTRSYSRYSASDKSPFDPFHVNSVDEEPDGRLLISARNTNAAYELDRSSGRIRTEIGGKASSYAMGPGTTFIAQHDARYHDDGTITIFDNGSGVPGAGSRPARGIVLKIDRKARRVTLAHSLERPEPVSALSQGNVQELPNGNYFVGWGGSAPFMSEFAHDGTLVFDATFSPPTDNTYRAYRAPWRARPFYPPKVAAAFLGGRQRVWASWNGATDVASWEVLAGPAPGALARVANVPRSGFETAASVPAGYRFVAVRALAGNGSVLGTSAVVSASATRGSTPRRTATSRCSAGRPSRRSGC